MRSIIASRAITVGVPHINLGIFSELPIPLPPLHEQQRIAGVLGAVTELIEHNERLANRLDLLAEALYQRESQAPGMTMVSVRDVAGTNEVSHSTRNHPDVISYLDISGTGTRRIGEMSELAWDEAPSRAR